MKAVPRLSNDIQALLSLTRSLKPHRRNVRSNKCLVFKYGFGDASGVGVGAAFDGPSQQHIVWESGTTKCNNICLILENFGIY